MRTPGSATAGTPARPDRPFFSTTTRRPRTARLSDITRHLNDTWLCWIGGTGDDDLFYFRIQSPVIIIEFDHHSGIYLSNENPKPFRIHTIVRTPNGNDYGVSLVRQATGTDHLLDGPD